MTTLIIQETIALNKKQVFYGHRVLNTLQMAMLIEGF